MEPIITSLLDLDFYKFNMAYMILEKNHANTIVKYQFKNRTKNIDLSEEIDVDELREQIKYIQQLKFQPEELKWLWANGNFSQDFIEKLQNVKLPMPKIKTNGLNKFYGIEVEGDWFSAIWWETLILSVINQLFNKKKYKIYDLLDENMMFKGIDRLENKIRQLKEYPQIKFMEFGTRRRLSGAWQSYVIERLKNEMPNQLLGTSNVLFAKEHGLKPLGTMAHELFMVYGGLFNHDLKEANKAVLDDWWSVFGGPQSIALTDTWGTDFFFKNFPKEHFVNFWGIRQDSGDPFEIGEKVISYYKNAGIDPSGKMVVFSDGLTVPKVIELYNTFKNRISLGFGIGTSLTNDVGGQPLSIVMKAVEANSKPLVKLSDNIEKAIGDEELIKNYKKQIGYKNNFSEKTIY